MTRNRLILTCVVLGAAGFVGLWIGIDDLTTTAVPLGWRAMAFIVAGTGLIWLTTASRVIRFFFGRQPKARDITLYCVSNLLGCVISVILASSTLSTHRNVLSFDDSADWPTNIFLITLFLLAVLCVANLTKLSGTLPSVFKPVTKTLTTAGVSLFAVFQFWYSNQYAPANVGTYVNLNATLKRVQVDDARLTPIVATVKITNPGTAKAAIVASELVVTGLRIDQAEVPRDTIEAEQAEVFSQVPGTASFSRFARLSGFEVLERSQLLDETRWLEPNEETLIQKVVYVDESGYEAVRLDATVIAADGRRFVVRGNPRPYEPPGPARAARRHDVLTLWPLAQPSELRRLVTGTHSILTVYLIGEFTSGVAAFVYWGRAAIDEAAQASENRRELLATTAVAEMPLHGVGEPGSASPSPD